MRTVDFTVKLAALPLILLIAACGTDEFELIQSTPTEVKKAVEKASSESEGGSGEPATEPQPEPVFQPRPQPDGKRCFDSLPEPLTQTEVDRLSYAQLLTALQAAEIERSRLVGQMYETGDKLCRSALMNASQFLAAEVDRLTCELTGRMDNYEQCVEDQGFVGMKRDCSVPKSRNEMYRVPPLDRTFAAQCGLYVHWKRHSGAFYLCFNGQTCMWNKSKSDMCLGHENADGRGKYLRFDNKDGIQTEVSRGVCEGLPFALIFVDDRVRACQRGRCETGGKS